jgi:hypothetical protein
LIIDDDPNSTNYGYPELAAKDSIIGNPNPDWIAGIQNRFTYRSFSLSFLIDIKHGGDIWNGTMGTLNDLGVGKETEMRGQTKIFQGVKASNGVNNDIAAPLNENYYKSIGSGYNGPAEQYVENGSWVRLREVTLTYTLPTRIMNKLRISNADVSIFGRNLFLITKYKGVDPETNLKGADAGQGFDYFNTPNTKSYGVALKIRF